MLKYGFDSVGSVQGFIDIKFGIPCDFLSGSIQSISRLFHRFIFIRLNIFRSE